MVKLGAIAFNKHGATIITDGYYSMLSKFNFKIDLIVRNNGKG